MKQLTLVLAAIFLLTGPTTAQNNVSVASLPAVVVKTVPQSGDVAVDPLVKELRVTFSKEMMTNEMWSWVQVSAATFPKTTSKSHFLEDKRTCVLPVQLERGKTYAIWINSDQHESFRDTTNRPAVHYLLVFQTKP